MSLASEFNEKVCAGVAGIIVQSTEQEDALIAIRNVCKHEDYHWPLAVFDLDKGVHVEHYDEEGSRISRAIYWEEILEDKTGVATGEYRLSGHTNLLHNPTAVVRGLHKLKEWVQPHIVEENRVCVLVMKNVGPLLQNPAFVQLIANSIPANKTQRLIIVFLNITDRLPPELQPLFEAGHIQQPFPSRDEITTIIEGQVAEEENIEFDKDSPAGQAVIDAAGGLTRLGVEDAVALSITRHHRVDPEVMFDLKAASFMSNASGLEISRSKLTFADYGGATFLKQFCVELLSHRSDDPRLRPKGIFLLGPPGVGKTLLAKCLGNEVGRPTAIVTLGSMKNRFQGGSQENLDGALRTLDAMSPCIAMFDEVEGQLSGGKSTGSLDAGTSSQMNSRLLSWLSDKTSDVFVICSCNDISSLMKEMPEFARMGRFDGLFFLDYPTRKSKDDIWRIHLKSYGFVDAEGNVENVDLPKDDNWTGAEIESCCRLARLRRKTIVEIGSVMPTISKQAGEQIQSVRQWAEGRCYAAEYEQLYDTNEHIGRIEAVGANGAGKRKLTRANKPSLN